MPPGVRVTSRLPAYPVDCSQRCSSIRLASGGLAHLWRQKSPMFKRAGNADHTWWHVMAPWSRNAAS